MSFNVHRAGSVFSPRFVVVINPPTKEVLDAVQNAGGPARAVSWAAGGFEEKNLASVAPTLDSLKRDLLAQGLPADAVDLMIQSAEASGSLGDGPPVVELPATVREAVESECMKVAIATFESRIRLADLIEGSDAASHLGALYRGSYRAAARYSGFEDVELLPVFPVFTGAFGYTRGGDDPLETRLVPFTPEPGQGRGNVVYGELARTEALFFRLAPRRVADWLRRRNVEVPDAASDDLEFRRFFLGLDHHAVERGEEDERARLVFALLHSMAHRTIRCAALNAGIERSALAEVLVPSTLGFFVYAAARGDFVLGGLQATFESELHSLLHSVVDEDHRCVLDPGCWKHGSACMGCLHLGETACRHFNSSLGREYLFGEGGYFSREY